MGGEKKGKKSKNYPGQWGEKGQKTAVGTKKRNGKWRMGEKKKGKGGKE